MSGAGTTRRTPQKERPGSGAAWVEFPGDGKLPAERRDVLVAIAPGEGGHQAATAVGFLRHGSRGPFWVVTGMGRPFTVTHWCDCLGDGWRSPAWPNSAGQHGRGPVPAPQTDHRAAPAKCSARIDGFACERPSHPEDRWHLAGDYGWFSHEPATPSSGSPPVEKRFTLKLSCCGREDEAPAGPMTWQEADAFRESYMSGPGVTCPERPHEGGHVRSATIVEASGSPPGAAGDVCPTCHSPDPHMFPATQEGGEVAVCRHMFHRRVTPQNTAKRIAEREALFESVEGVKP